MILTETPERPVISGVTSASEGQRVTLNCTVRLSCPARSPTLRWHWDRGVGGNSTESSGGGGSGRPVLTAVLSFAASYPVKPRLRCEVRYHSGQTAAALMELHVTFSPRDVEVQVASAAVQEGASVLLTCACKADPPVTEYSWSYTQRGRPVILRSPTHSVRLYNVTRDMRVRCSAQNPIGRGDSPPTALTMQYKPSIARSSSCRVEGLLVQCRCLVDANPRAVVTWSVNGSSPPRGFNVSGASHPGTLGATLRGPMERPLTVLCLSVNPLGNDTLLLLRGEGDADTSVAGLLWMLIPAAAVALVVSSSLLLLCCRRRAGQAALRGRPAVCPAELGLYRGRTPLYINCTEVTNVYSNGSYQLVYQNCTPLFVRAKQTRPMARRGGERRVGERKGRKRGGKRGGGTQKTRPSREQQNPEPETPIYLEIL